MDDAADHLHNESTLARGRTPIARAEAPVNVRLALPTLDAIKLAVSMALGIRMMLRAAALAEINRGHW